MWLVSMATLCATLKGFYYHRGLNFSKKSCVINKDECLHQKGVVGPPKLDTVTFARKGIIGVTCLGKKVGMIRSTTWTLL